MSQPPKDREEFWIRFVCSFLFFGLILAISGFRWMDAWGVATTLMVWAAITLAVSLYTALQGDAAWEKLIRFFSGWRG